jgi:hypothetical protein
MAAAKLNPSALYANFGAVMNALQTYREAPPEVVAAAKEAVQIVASQFDLSAIQQGPYAAHLQTLLA